MRCASPARSRQGRRPVTAVWRSGMRRLRAGLVTPLPGGPGIDPAGTMAGARGASLKRGASGEGNAFVLHRVKRGLG